MTPEVVICVAELLTASLDRTIESLPVPPIVELSGPEMAERFGNGFSSLYHSGEGVIYMSAAVRTSQGEAHEYAWHLLWKHDLMTHRSGLPDPSREQIDLVARAGYICG